VTLTHKRTAGAAALVLLLACPARAQVTRLEITSRQPTADGRFETIRGRMHGEVDPANPHNRIIQDIDLAPRNANGKVEYVATFALTKPIYRASSSGVLLYSVVNRGNGASSPSAEGHISLVSGWQGDVTPTETNQTIRVPVAQNADGSAITGPVLARFFDLPKGTTTAPIRIGSLGTAFYPPVALDTSKAALTFHTSETNDGRIGGERRVASNDWAFADCRTVPFPGTPDPMRVCLKNGFDTDKLYELVYTAKDPLVLGVGLAATRDIVSFFRYADADAAGTANPIAKMVTRSVAVGVSQSGNFLRTFVNLGFNADLNGRFVWEGILPYIAGRQTPIDFRFAIPGGAAGMYEPGSEPALTWSRYADAARGRPAPASLLDRCNQSRTCPKVIEAFGATEFWALRMTPDLIGTDEKLDVPLPGNVRRYYMPGTTHGGGPGGFEVSQPLNDRCQLATNPNPMSDTLRALTTALIDWVVRDTLPPPSRYPTLAAATLVPATAQAIGFPALGNLYPVQANPLLDYDLGPRFDYADMTGEIDRQPPIIKRAIPAYAVRVDTDGNEVAGVASPLHQAPLGTYLGWNLEASGFFKGQLCGFTGGYVPFARTLADRLKSGDPRPSIEERYGTLDGYVCRVTAAADALVRERLLLKDDRDRIVGAAAKSRVLPAGAESSPELRAIAAKACQ
jgi:hypothetical protein